ncbi:MAG TPA: L,D-transpeptidase family protein [Thermoanaerobaculia bacterium]|nr:L,D-transpeptidase family protein [Thermoanaerobaculia bacterium]
MLAFLLALSLDIAPLLHRDLVAGERICDAAGLRTFYARREHRAAWDERSAASLLRAIDALAEDGLEPNRYHREALLRLPPDAERDVLATDAFLAAATHLSRGIVDPQFARPAWCAPPPKIDVAALLQSALDDGTIEETLARVSVRHEGYTRLRKALAGYRELARTEGWPVVPAGRTLRVGDEDERVVVLRKRLYAPGDSAVFDAGLEELVRHFQSHHGITVDGIVGPETLRELNVSAADRARQIAVNMERWRWMPEDLGPSYVLVNIAAFRLDVIEGDHSVLTMKTVVGKEYTRTPFFAARIVEVIVNPWWNVPDSIATKELWPKQRRDPSYFAREHMVVSNGRIRQRPGDWNALGRLKFNLPNRYDVYLHDTPAKSLFARSFRAFSHGCIRLERPMDLALYLLRDQPRWTTAAIESDIATGTERAIRLTTPQPVYILYWTAWVGDDGHMEFHQDHYGRDAALAAALD